MLVCLGKTFERLSKAYGWKLNDPESLGELRENKKANKAGGLGAWVRRWAATGLLPRLPGNYALSLGKYALKGRLAVLRLGLDSL